MSEARYIIRSDFPKGDLNITVIKSCYLCPNNIPDSEGNRYCLNNNMKSLGVLYTNANYDNNNIPEFCKLKKIEVE